MARILISFVGTGALTGKGDSMREYRKTLYRIGDKELGEFPFVAAALTTEHKVDKVILIGTAHSMWEEVYRYFSEKNKREICDKVYIEVSDYCSAADSQSPLELPHKREIESAVGDAQIVIIRYGLDEGEISENVGNIIKLNEQFNVGDEIIVDITHAFRSLPMLIMNLLIYMKNVSRKNIIISHIYYGMLEMFNERKYAPIVDIKGVLDLNDWITGAYSFSQYGNAYKVADILEGVETSLASRLRQFSDNLNLNHLFALEQEVNNLAALRKAEYQSPLSEMVVKPIVDEFLRDFGVVGKNHALFQFRIAQWQYKHRNYASSLISLQESILTYICQKEELDWRNKEDRDEAKKRVNSYPDLHCYFEINRLRNSVAHNLKTEKNAQTIIVRLGAALKKVGKVIKS